METGFKMRQALMTLEVLFQIFRTEQQQVNAELLRMILPKRWGVIFTSEVDSQKK